MCFSNTATLAMIGLGTAATVITARRGEPAAIPLTLAYFTLMEGLQAVGYQVVDQCGTPVNRAVTVASYVHIGLQPLVINAFLLAITPGPVSPAMRRTVLGLAGLGSALVLARLLPIGTCPPGQVLCGPGFCTRSGEWHIAWDMPLNGMWNWLQPLTDGMASFPAYVAAVFLLPLAYGAWRFVLMHAALGPVLATLLTDDPGEMPAIWCLFSVGLLLMGLSPAIRRGLAPRPRKVTP